VAQNDTDVISIDESANGTDITVPQGATLRLCLPESPTTGFRWNLASDGAPALEMTGEEREAGGGVGQPGSHIWLFRAAYHGTGSIDLRYARPWEGGDAGQTFTLGVQVE
jgi:inhibitor of cysteine peptidase